MQRLKFMKELVEFSLKVIVSEKKPAKQCESLEMRAAAAVMRANPSLLLRMIEAGRDRSLRVCQKAAAGPDGGCGGAKGCEVFCSTSADANSATVAAADTGGDAMKEDLDLDGFQHGLSALNRCLLDLWTRWSFMFQAQSWEHVFTADGLLPEGSLQLRSASGKHAKHNRVKDLDRRLVRDIVFRHPQLAKCEPPAPLSSDATADERKKHHAMKHQCWSLLKNAARLGRLEELREQAL